jgi:hypothetical protein
MFYFMQMLTPTPIFFAFAEDKIFECIKVL